MTKLNSKGFSPLHILLLIVIVGMIGGVGYYVYNSQKKTNTSLDNAAKSQSDPQKSENKEEEKIKLPEGFKEYVSKEGFSFAYPETWGVESVSNNNVISTVLKSPDYQAQQGGYGGTLAGSVISLSTYDINSQEITHYSVDSILDGTYDDDNRGIPKFQATDVKKTMLDDQKAVSYTGAHYEGPGSKAVRAEKNNHSYIISIEEDVDGPTFNANIAVFEQIVQSFKFN